MRFKLTAPLVHNRDCGDGCRIAQWAEGSTTHVLGKVLYVVNVFSQAGTIMEEGESFLEPVSPFTAGNTPAAAFMLVELHHAEREFNHAGLVVQNYDTA